MTQLSEQQKYDLMVARKKAQIASHECCMCGRHLDGRYATTLISDGVAHVLCWNLYAFRQGLPHRDYSDL